MKKEDLSRKHHDMKSALSSLFGVVEVVKAGDLDFDSDDGRELLEQAEAGYQLLAREIEHCFEIIRQLEQS